MVTSMTGVEQRYSQIGKPVSLQKGANAMDEHSVPNDFRVECSGATECLLIWISSTAAKPHRERRWVIDSFRLGSSRRGSRLDYWMRMVASQREHDLVEPAVGLSVCLSRCVASLLVTTTVTITAASTLHPPRPTLVTLCPAHTLASVPSLCSPCHAFRSPARRLQPQSQFTASHPRQVHSLLTYLSTGRFRIRPTKHDPGYSLQHQHNRSSTAVPVSSFAQDNPLIAIMLQ